MLEADNITWKSDYETGIDAIDEQHQILVATLKEANDTLSSDYSLENLENITKDLLSYALYHFETEEEMMQESGYDKQRPGEYESHMKQHRDFSAKVVKIRESLKAGQLIEQEELIGFLINWLINHINKTDKKLGVFLQKEQ
ncbi:MAG: bacteriohemerythrin [Campylobacterota bacterium]